MSTTAKEATEAGRETALVDLVIRGQRIYSLAADGAVQRALAIREGRIIAVADTPEGLVRAT